MTAEDQPLDTKAQAARIRRRLELPTDVDDSVIIPLAAELLFQQADMILEPSLTSDQQQRLAIHRLLTPEIVESVTGVQLGLEEPFRPSLETEDETLRAHRLAYAKVMNLFADRGLIHAKSLLHTTLHPDGSIDNNRWPQNGPTAAEQSVRYATGGKIRPEWRERKLKNLTPEQLKELHAEAMDTLISTMQAIYEKNQSDPKFDIGWTLPQIQPLIHEYLFHKFSHLMLSGDKKVHEKYSLSPVVTTEQTTTVLMKEFYLVANRILANNPYHVASLAFHLGVSLKEDIAKRTSDPALKELSKWLLATSRASLMEPRPVSSLIPELDGAALKLFVSDGYNVMTNEFSAEEEMRDLIATLDRDNVTIRKGIMLPVSYDHHGGALEFKTRAGVVVQLQPQDWEKASIAAIETEEGSIHFYRFEDTSWGRIGTITIKKDNFSAPTRVTYTANSEYQEIIHNTISFWNGPGEEHTTSLLVSTDYFGHGNIVFNNGRHSPIRVNAWNSEKPPGLLFLPHVSQVPKVPEDSRG